MLAAEGFDCVQAADGLAAVAHINRALMRRKALALALAAARREASDRYLTAGYPNPNPPGGVGEGEVDNCSTNSNGNAARTDVILMDSNMPKMNGPDAVVEIRKLGYTLPIFGVTGFEDPAAFMRAGVDGVMMKPVKADELVKAIKLALRKTVDRVARDKSSKQATQQLAPSSITPPPLTVDEEHLASIEKWLTAPSTAAAKK
jgi:CheY-like chemotaxis protein